MTISTKPLLDKNTLPFIQTIKTLKDERGSLGIVEALPDTGFEFKRLYFLYSNTTNETRGNHAHINLKQCILAIHGSFEITLEGITGEKLKFNLDSPEKVLIVPPGYWRELKNFSEDAVCLVAASEEYSEADYIRDYDQFLQWVKEN